MSNIYSCEKVTYSKLWFSKFKKLVFRSVLGELQLRKISLNYKTSCCNLKIRDLGAKLCGLSIVFILKGIMIKSQKAKSPCQRKSPCFLLNKNIKKRRNRKCEILHRILGRLTLCFSSYKNCKLKVKLWWTGAGKKKKKNSAFFATLIFSAGYFFKICVLSQCIVH